VTAVILGTILFFDAIVSTVHGNPHPQINYIIFVLIIAGCIQMSMHVHRINQEGNYFKKYQIAVKNGLQKKEIIDFFKNEKKDTDVLLLIQLIEELRGKSLTSVQHSAIESELNRFEERQHRRLMLSNFMSGMMVGMGLLGTFIGLLGALAEIGNLIGSFSLGAGMTDPVAAITELVARLTAPMQAMGVAFSASLFGVLGSLIMGALMVAVRSGSSDLVAIVQSETSLMVDISEDEKNVNAITNYESVTSALSKLAEHSPILQALSIALDQSEKRVRELTGGISDLIAKIKTSYEVNEEILSLKNKEIEQNEMSLKLISSLEFCTKNISDNQNHITHTNNRIVDLINDQNKNSMLKFEKYTNYAENQIEAQNGILKDLIKNQKQQIEKIFDIQMPGFDELNNHLIKLQNSMHELTENFNHILLKMSDAANSNSIAEIERDKFVNRLLIANNEELESRKKTLNHIENILNETKIRNDQITYLLSSNLTNK
jgi:flagellar motor component MotA